MSLVAFPGLSATAKMEVEKPPALLGVRELCMQISGLPQMAFVNEKSVSTFSGTVNQEGNPAMVKSTDKWPFRSATIPNRPSLPPCPVP